jgi:hypothetical protein
MISVIAAIYGQLKIIAGIFIVHRSVENFIGYSLI